MSGWLTITGIRVYEYRMPMKVGFGTSRGVVDRSRNLVVTIEADLAGETVRGIGEGVPRGPKITGDTLDGSWACVTGAAAVLEGRRLPVGSSEAALDAVRELERELHGVAAAHAIRANRAKPYRGTLAGLDVALLDVLARARRQSVAGLLGERRERVGVSAGTMSTVSDREEIERRTRRTASNFPMSRFKASGDLDEALDLTALIARANREAGAVKPVWIDVNEGFSPDDARRYVHKVVADMLDGELPPHMIVEQPVAKKHLDVLAELQRTADEALSEGRTGGLRTRWASRRSPSGPLTGPMRLTVIADESLWDADDYRALVKLGGTRGINIKVPKIGGVLAAYDLALEAMQDNPEIELYIGGMLGTSDLTAWALHNLARAMPRLDYFTSTPPANVDARIAEPHMRYRDQASRQLIDQVGDGIGAALSGSVIGGYVSRTARFPRPAGPARSGSAGGDEVRDIPDHLVRLGAAEFGSHLLERAALCAGLATHRTTPRRVEIWRPGTGERVAFAGAAADGAAEGHAAASVGHESRAVELQHETGEPYQFIVVGDRVVSVIHRRPAVVYGDGVSTVSDVITHHDDARRGAARRYLSPLRIDDHVRRQLDAQGLAWDSVPEPGRSVVINPAGSLWEDGETIQVLSETHQSVLDAAVRAVSTNSGLPVTGVDLLLSDHRLPFEEQGGIVTAVWDRPAIGPARLPVSGPAVDVAREILADQCRRHDMTLGEPAEQLSLDVTVRGRVQAVGYRQWMRRIALASGVSGWVRNDTAPDLVTARLSGPAGPVAALVSSAISGPRKASPTSVQAIPHDGAPATGPFELRR